jgi:hypothetical protein
MANANPFKIYECDFGLTLNGVNYDFDHVQNLQIENPERTRLVRGANAGNKVGLVYKEGIKDAKTITLTIIGMPLELHNLLKQAYDDKTRMDCYCVQRSTGSAKIAKNTVLSQEPIQLLIDDSPDSMNTSLVFESYDVSEVYKE